jgi:hypothetical protein
LVDGDKAPHGNSRAHFYAAAAEAMRRILVERARSNQLHNGGDLVRKSAALNCQIRDHLEAALPGYAACFGKLWESLVPWHLLRHYPTARQLQEAGVTSLCHSLRQAGIRFQQRTLQTVVEWAHQAAPGDVAARQHLRIALALYDDRQHKTQEIQALERDLAGRLVQTPYLLLLSFPGINHGVPGGAHRMRRFTPFKSGSRLSGTLPTYPLLVRGPQKGTGTFMS